MYLVRGLRSRIRESTYGDHQLIEDQKDENSEAKVRNELGMRVVNEPKEPSKVISKQRGVT